jgi:hypothetical protein
MSQLEDLVRFENANSGVAFREGVYAAAEQTAFLRDVLALANAAVQGPRFLIVGVRDTVGGKRTIEGIGREQWTELKNRLGAWVGGIVEPPLKIAVRALEIEGKLVGLVCLAACEDPPYLLSEQAPAGLPIGGGWVRRGTQHFPLLRADLQRMFEAKLAVAAPVADVTIGFAGETPQHEIELPILRLDRLPSAVAAEKLRKVLAAKQSAKAMFGRTVTQLSRLVHAQLFGVDRAYESHSDESLRMLIAGTAESHRAADEHYAFETRAHRLDLVVGNASGTPLGNAMLHMRLPRIDAVGVAERLYQDPERPAKVDGYPRVHVGAQAIDIETDLGVLPPGKITRAFREPPRFWARPGAAGKTLPLDVTLHARELREPIRETLVLRIVDRPV